MMLSDVVDYLELDHMSEDELYNMQREHKLRTLTSLRKVITDNLHRLEIHEIEEYKEYLLQQVDEEINDIDFYSTCTTYTYAEQNYKEFLSEYKSKIADLFNEFLCVEVN